MRFSSSTSAAVMLGSLLLTSGTANVARAQAAATAPIEITREFDIPAQALSTSLGMFAEQSGLQLVYSSSLVRDLRGAELKGNYRTDAALRRLLEGTGLDYRLGNRNTVVVEKAIEGRRVLGPVRVEGRDPTAVNGVNGSTDVTATEGTGSYTSGLLSIASKTPQSMKDTPQSVSVITQQRMQDQNIVDFETAMREATGVTVLTSGTYLKSYISRGFVVDSFQIDGGAPLALALNNGSLTNFSPQIDMAMYDHVEVLRGADGLLNGYGTPGATVNLVRKRPVSKGQVMLEGQVGSWSQMRTVIDATGPLGFDGRLRGRGVTTYQDNDFFYDTASHNSTLTYGMLEFDIMPDTLLSGGFSVSRVDGVPWNSGLPRYLNGDDLKLPRSTCLCLPWSRTSYDTTELFTQLQQELPGDWSIKVNLMRIEQDMSSKFGEVVSPVLDSSGIGTKLNGWMSTGGSTQDGADVTVSGSFELFGLRQRITAGANYQQVDSYFTQNFQLYRSSTRIPSIFEFDPNLYPEPGSSQQISASPGFGQTQWGAYAALNLTVLPRLHVTTGLRYSHYEFEQLSQTLCTVLYQPNCPSLSTVESSEIKRYSGNDFSWPPTYSLSYDLLPNVSLYGSYTDVYQSQTDVVDHSLNPLDPATGANAQLGVNMELAGGKLNATFGVYYSEMSNLAQFMDYGPYESTQGRLPDGQRRCCYSGSEDYALVSQGVDMEVSGEVLPNWQLSAGYSYNHNEYKGQRTGSNEGTPLQSQQPEHLFKLSTSYRVSGSRWWRPFTIGGSLHGQTKAYQAGSSCLAYVTVGRQTICSVSVPYDYTQGAYVVGRLHMGVDVTKQWQVSVAVENPTDKRYYQTMGSADHGNMYGEPRSYQLTVRGMF